MLDSVLGFLNSVLGFVVILCPLVVFHEFGHFIFARIFGVKAEVFSVGFGPKLWSRQWGETEFRLSAVPLGGYVKLLGEEPGQELPPEERHRALQKAAPWKRFFIFFGGPLFNFILAALVFMLILVIGEPRVGNTVGRVVEGSYAATAGFQSGDQVISINGESVRYFEDIARILNQSAGKTLEFKILHPGAQSPVLLPVQSQTAEGFSIYGEVKDVGDIDGLEPSPRSARLGISNSKSAAGMAGLKTGDEWVSLNGQVIDNWETLERIAAGLTVGQSVPAVVRRNEAGTSREITLNLARPKGTENVLRSWGVCSVELFVEKVVTDSPAAKAGLQAGDRMVEADGHVLTSFYGLRKKIQESGEKHGKVELVWEREGRRMSSVIIPTENKPRDALLKRVSEFTIGVMPMSFAAVPVMVKEQIWNPFTLFYRGVERMLIFTWRNVVSIAKMVTGQVSVSTLGGPILIGKIAGESMSRGVIEFLRMMAILSVGLGILNILPIPVLDGGHLVLLGVEVVRGRPLSMRQIEILQQVGLSLIVLLMVVVMRNDLLRIFS